MHKNRYVTFCTCQVVAHTVINCNFCFLRHVPAYRGRLCVEHWYKELPVPSWSCSQAVSKPVWHIPIAVCTVKNSWWWTEELSETCRVLFKNNFQKLVHLAGFIIRIYSNVDIFFCKVMCLCVTWWYAFRSGAAGHCGLCWTVQQPLAGPGFFSLLRLDPYTHTHSVELPWTSDRPESENCTWNT